MTARATKKKAKTAPVPAVADNWRDVPSYEGLYEVSDRGEVRSLRRMGKALTSGRPLRLAKSGNGYLRVTLSQGGKAQRFSIHRIVLTAFIGIPNEHQEARHLNGCRTDNRLSNLAWGSRSENAQDRIRHGTHVDNRGERHGMTSLKNEDIRLIRSLKAHGILQRTIAARLGIGEATVSRIVNRRGWTHIVGAAQ